uniref:Methyltransferase domain-containing protein n=1 Tax=Compsopogon caeruleus TaxID=31354 RepID=A0A7S1XBV8_9RHOD|mmetsp:Transcript_1266/g.2667  ORF Transcript_1266/g.2667 Transcript_1266/m.2667 type:complete len:211 (+) Transcript_1266:321-953(+)
MEPKDTAEYKKQVYWEGRFAVEEDYDWVAKWDHYSPHLLRLVRQDHRVLVLGCGNSELSRKLFECGVKKIVNVDFSESVIRRMRQRHPEMTWIVGDIRTLRESLIQELGIGSVEGAFDVVVEKATLDALIADSKSQWEPEEGSKRDMALVLGEVSAVLKDGSSRFVSITFQQPHFRKRFFLDSSTLVVDEVHTIEGKSLDAFIFIARKSS